MITNLKPYPAYKDSGVPWLGEVPEHWDVRRLKQVARVNPSKAEARTLLEQDAVATFLPMERVYADGRIEVTEHLPISSVWNGFTYFRRGDVIVAKITPCFENGKGACLDTLPTEIGFGSTEFHVLRTRSSMTAPFLYRITTLPDFRRLGADAMTGAAGQQRVPESFVANFIAPLPPLPEQTAIVRFLDYMDRRIRCYIRAKQKLIKLLEEYKQALIHQAVTGKIDVRTCQPYPAYKPSGVEWLGQVPEHWEVAGLRYVTSCLDGRRVPLNAVERGSMQGPYPYWGANKIIDYINDYLFDEPLVLLGEDGAPFFEANKEVAFFVEGKIWVNNHAHVIRCKGRVQPRYLVHVLNLTDYTRFVDGSTRDKLTQQAMGSIPVILPRLEEQTAIVEYLDAQTAKLDAAIATSRREIELLREYRTRLIADVVTGKVDVCEVAAQLPEEPPEEEAELMDTDETAEGEAIDDDAAAEALSEEEVEP